MHQETCQHQGEKWKQDVESGTKEPIQKNNKL